MNAIGGLKTDKEVFLLLRMPNWLGDCVMALPALRHLSEALPGTRIFLAGRGRFRDLLAGQPGVAGYIVTPEKGAANLFRSLSGVGKKSTDSTLPRKIDIGLLFTNSFSTAMWVWRIGAKTRIGYRRDCRGLFLTHPIPCGGIEKSWHSVRYYLWLARFAETMIGKSGRAPRREVESTADYLLPRLSVEETDRSAAAETLRQAGTEGRYAVIAPASAYGKVKDWPPEHYRRLVRSLNLDFGLPVVVTGGAEHAAVCAEIAAGQKAVLNLAGKTTLPAFAGVLAGAELFVGGDSGGAHLAAALDVPTIVIFGITNPDRTRQTGARVRIFGGENRDLDLKTMESREKAARALAAILPESILEAVGGFLGREAGIA
ncbi:MAG: glycosyltransferase family 9 protein [Planctomycetota bacterium]|jgi:heptosyltransferase-2|nr:glycosyltransferase family 9 protein [Planctomycetota bacterium]